MIQPSLFGPTGIPGGTSERRVRARARHVPLIVGYGGGVNSLAVLLGLRDRGLRPDLISFANTGDPDTDEGGEHKETYAYLREILAPWLVRVGFPALTWVHKDSPTTGDRSLYDECIRRKTLPSRAFGMSSCAHRWKIEPQEKFLNHWPPAVECWKLGDKPIKILGYDDGESHRSGITEDDKLVYWYALREWGWDRAACERRILDEGLPLPPKSSCFYCPSKKKHEILSMAVLDPDSFAKCVAMERNAQANTENPLHEVKGLGRTHSWEELVAATPEQRKEMPNSPVEGCMICVEGDDD